MWTCFPCNSFLCVSSNFQFCFSKFDIEIAEKRSEMVSKVDEGMKRNKEQQQQQQQHQQQKHIIMQCNKGKSGKFKRSSSNLEEDGASSAILFLACIACAPHFHG